MNGSLVTPCRPDYPVQPANKYLDYARHDKPWLMIPPAERHNPESGKAQSLNLVRHIPRDIPANRRTLVWFEVGPSYQDSGHDDGRNETCDQGREKLPL